MRWVSIYRKDPVGKGIYLLSILLSIGLILTVFSGLNPQQVYVYFNSDTLYLPSIFRDLFVDWSGFSGWHLNGAPNFFPDMLFYFIINTLFADFRVAMLLYSILQYFLLLMIIRWLFITVYPGIREEALATGNLVILVIFLVTFNPGDFVFTFYLLSISYHLGAFLMALGALIFTFRYIKTQRRPDLVLLFFMGLLGVMNDKLFIVMYILPLFSLVLFMGSKAYRRRILILFVNALIVTILGTLIYNGIRHSGTVHIISLSWKVMHFSAIPLSFRTFIHQHLTYLQALDFRGGTVILSLLSILLTIILVVRRLRRFYGEKEHQPDELFLTMYLVFSVAFWFIVLATPIINGSYVGFAILRYNIYAIYLSLFNFGVLLMLLVQHHGFSRHLWVVPVSLLMLFGLVSMKHLSNITSGGLKKITHHYPSMVQRMDSVAVSNDLHFGVATYWNAKYITMFSTTGLRVYTVYPDLSPWYHVMNERWYRPGGKGVYGDPAFTFIYMDAMDPEKVNAKLGEPLENISFEESRIRVYPPFIFTVNKQPEFIPDR